MKILVAHNRRRSSSPGGEDRVVDQEHEALVDAGHDVRRFEYFSDAIADFPLRRKALVPLQLLWNRRAARDLGAAIEAFQPDVVHVQNVFPLLSPSVLQSCQRHRKPCVVTFHNYRQICSNGSFFRTGFVCRDCVGRRLPTPAVRHGCYRDSAGATLPIAVATVAHRQLWRSAPSAYVFISDAERLELESLKFPPSRCFVKPNFTMPVAPKDATDELVVYLGQLSVPKGLRVLMQAWDAYSATRPAPGLRLAIAGSGPLDEEVRAWAASRPSVDVLGLLTRDECTALVRRARALVAPSEWPEPFGLVVAEAMAAGVPPVASAHGSFVEMITDGVDGMLYPPGDVGALARHLQGIESSPNRLLELGKAAKKTYEKRFTAAKNVAELEAIYRFAIDNPRWLDVP